MSDSDLAVSVYDPEDNLNFYGSPIERADLSVLEAGASTADGEKRTATTSEPTQVILDRACTYIFHSYMLPLCYILTT